MSLQKVEKKVRHLFALDAALPQLVGYVVGDVARPSLVLNATTRTGLLH
jgi:hypothetical protein